MKNETVDSLQSKQKLQDLIREGIKDVGLVTRSDWGALPPKATDPITTYPISKVFLTYFTNTPECRTREECIKTVKKIQQSHMKKGMDDIAFNFLIGSDGNVYEGRGFHTKSDKSLDFNPEWFGRRMDLAYIGDFRDRIVPPAEHIKAAIAWGTFGVGKKYLTENYATQDIREKGKSVDDLIMGLHEPGDGPTPEEMKELQPYIDKYKSSSRNGSEGGRNSILDDPNVKGPEELKKVLQELGEAQNEHHRSIREMTESYSPPGKSSQKEPKSGPSKGNNNRFDNNNKRKH